MTSLNTYLYIYIYRKKTLFILSWYRTNFGFQIVTPSLQSARNNCIITEGRKHNRIFRKLQLEIKNNVEYKNFSYRRMTESNLWGIRIFMSILDFSLKTIPKRIINPNDFRRSLSPWTTSGGVNLINYIQPVNERFINLGNDGTSTS